MKPSMDDLVGYLIEMLDDGCQYKLHGKGCWESYDKDGPQGTWCDHCWTHSRAAGAVYAFRKGTKV